MKKISTRKIALLAMLSAMAFVLFLFEIPLIPGNSYLKLDISDVPALAGGVLLGPVSAVIIEAVKNIIELLVKGMGSQLGFGNIMNFVVGVAYVVPFALAYKGTVKKYKTEIAVLISSAIGLVSIVVLGICGNYVIAPLFFRYFMNTILTGDALWTAIWSATILNLVKGVFLSIVSFPLIKVVCERIKKLII
ncbi:MAG: ECF transporter S component [Clostridia bacterium]|nr:ECF transporter S component [Clostridia bacterium]